MRDDEDQFDRAQKLIRREAQAGNPVLVSHLVLLETEWVLRSRYKLTKAEILGAFSDLLSAVDMCFEEEHTVEEALFIWKNSPAQFADCLIATRYGTLGCKATATFDAAVMKLPGFISV